MAIGMYRAHNVRRLRCQAASRVRRAKLEAWGGGGSSHAFL